MKTKIMKKLFIIILLAPLVSFGQDITTYYLIRHAEKNITDLTNKNPHLTEKGKQRAISWVSIFKNIQFDKIYSTNLHRTIETARPIALERGISIQKYDPKQLYNEAFKKRNKGKTILVVGHSNTTPVLANKILEKEYYSEIDESIHGNLYILQVFNDNNVTSQLISIE
jgi:broad specificity phosphatase PhoE